MSGDQEVQDIEQDQKKVCTAIRNTLLRDLTLAKIPGRAMQIWHYGHRFTGKTGFVFHAAQVARMCGLAYDSTESKMNFRRNYLEVLGEEGVDWDFVKKSEIFKPSIGETSGTVEENSIVLPVPGSATGETVTISSDNGATKFLMLTEKFARRMVLRFGQGGLDKEYAEILLVVNSIIVKCMYNEFHELL